MKTVTLCSAASLCPLEDAWNALAGDVPFLTWDWLTTWWSVYGEPLQGQGRPPRRKLYVVATYASAPHELAATDRLIGLAPLYWEQTLARGNVLRLLGTGEGAAADRR